MTEISPAILSNDILDFRIKYGELLMLHHHFKKLHIDFEDGEFVPTKTIEPADLDFIKPSPMSLMAHLMTFAPEKYFKELKAHHFEWVLFHYEAFKTREDLHKAIKSAEHHGLKPGLVLNPETPYLKIAHFIHEVKLIQLMGIHPGAQGRTFLPATLEKIRELRAHSKSVIICVDGGVRVGIAKKCVAAGANILISGSAILRSEDPETAIEALKEDIET